MNSDRTRLLCYATLPDKGSFTQRIEAATAAGFDELSLWLMSLDEGRAELGSLEAVAGFLADAGMRASVLELLLTWPDGEPGACDAEVAVMQAAAEIMQPDVILAGCMGPSLAPGAAACLKAQCRALAPYKVALEFLPWSGLPTLASAVDLVREIDEENLGFVLDTWHFAWAGQDFTTLESIPAEKIHFVQLGDLASETSSDVIVETLGHRLRPGEGVVDWPRMRRVLDAEKLGCPIGTEQFNDAVKAMSLEDASRYLFDSVQHIMNPGD